MALSEAHVCEVVYVPQEDTKAQLRGLNQLLDVSILLPQG